MTQTDFEKGMLAMATWRLASSNHPMELLAIACTLRNAVVRRGGRGSYADSVQYFLDSYPLRPLPRGTEPALVDLNEGLLYAVDKVYDFSQPDVTSTKDCPNGASVFCDPRRNPGFGVGRKLIGQYGSLYFYE